MKLSSKETLNMLEELNKDSKNKYWIEHSICVGNSSEKSHKHYMKKAMT